MASREKTPLQNQIVLPAAGTIAHLEYLKNIEIDEQVDAKKFLASTMAATSLARMIRRHRTYWPMSNMQTADLDTRLLRKFHPGLPVFRGSIGLRDYLPDHNHLVIFGRPSNIYSYNLSIPITRAHHYDPSRPSQAAYRMENDEAYVFNEMASTDYPEHAPEILVSVVQEAADDLLQIFHKVYEGHSNPPATTYREVEVKWHPDYLNDDPDEFLKTA